MSFTIRQPPPWETDPEIPLKPHLILEYWPSSSSSPSQPSSSQAQQPNLIHTRISVLRKNHDFTSHYQGRDSDVIYGVLEVPGVREGGLGWVFEFGDVRFREKVKDAVWNLGAELLIEGVVFRRLEIPGIAVDRNVRREVVVKEKDGGCVGRTSFGGLTSLEWLAQVVSW